MECMDCFSPKQTFFDVTLAAKNSRKTFTLGDRWLPGGRTCTAIESPPSSNSQIASDRILHSATAMSALPPNRTFGVNSPAAPPAIFMYRSGF